MTASYKILFSLDILHEYYKSGFCNDFSIVPSPATAKILAGNQLLYRTINHQLIILTKVNPGGSAIDPDKDKVISKLPAEACLVFYLVLNNPQFFTITQSESRSFRTHKYYLNNLSGNAFDNTHYLSKPHAAFNMGTAYSTGDLVVQGNDCFECLATHTNQLLTNNAFWFRRGAFQYTTTTDSIRVIPAIYNYQVEPADAAMIFTIRAFALNKTNNSVFDVEMPLLHARFIADENTRDVQLNLSGLSAGRYRITVNDKNLHNEPAVYIDDTMYARQVAGVVEIYNHLPAASSFALYTVDGKTKDTPINNRPDWLKYVIRFANRQAIWKYIALRKSLADISLNPNPMNYDFASTPFPPPPLPSRDADIFLSNKPIPISESPPAFKLEVLGGINGESPPASAPDPQQTGMLVMHNNDYYFNIYLNY